MFRYVLLSALILPATSWCQEGTRNNAPVPSVADVAKLARESIVVVTTEDRDGKQGALGTGFVIDGDGLVATALHVIGEARPIRVESRDGKRLNVKEVFASDRNHDLAILRVETDAEITPLPLADSELEEGESVVSMGHPLGLKNSVLSGLVAGAQTNNGTDFWQVAMTVEPGHSGGPLLDRDGKVHGVIVMKQVRPEPFGFAVKGSLLRKLLERPNPVAIDQWKTIGQIDANRWQAKMGARWRQRSGRLLVEGPGKGFGGRSLLLRMDEQPSVPFEMAVDVKLDDESGAAGLLFHSDGGDKHFGFYPSSGRIRLTRFEGPSVYTWNVLSEIESEHYRRDEWNELRLRVEKNRIIGYLNGHKIVKTEDVKLPLGRIGLCKFRDTKAQFRHFRFGDTVPSRQLSEDRIATLKTELSTLGGRSSLLDIDLIGQATDVSARLSVLESQARALEAEASELRSVGEDIRIANICTKLSSIVDQERDDQIDLLAGALWIAKLDNAELDVETYVAAVEAMANQIRQRFKSDASPQERIELLDKHLFEENGFHGSRTDYYNAANSHLDRVIDDREGLPITLSVLYMSLAERLDLNVVGVGLPGHFVVRHEPDAETANAGDGQLIDVFSRGKRLSRNEANVMVFRALRSAPRESDFKASTKKAILLRMLNNLRGTAQAGGDSEALRRYVEAMVAIDPDDAGLRGARSVVRHQAGRKKAAVDDLDWILEREPEGIDLNQVRRMRELFAE